MYVLTRYLYIHDEVVLALLTALLSKRNLNECYFWLFELYFSEVGADLFPLLKQFYQEFYEERQPAFAHYLLKKENAWKEATMLVLMEQTTIDGQQSPLSLAAHAALLQPAACVVRNLFRCTASPSVFLHRQFGMGLSNGMGMGMGLPNGLGTGNFLPISADISALLAADFEPVPCVNDTLYRKRLYAIPPSIAAFQLERWQLYAMGDVYLDFLEENWYHWEYYAMRSPVWLQRLQQHGGMLNHAQRKIVFTSDDWQETFYGLYAYDFDELGQETFALSHGELLPSHCTWFDWLTDTGLSAMMPPVQLHKLCFLIPSGDKFAGYKFVCAGYKFAPGAEDLPLDEDADDENEESM